MEVNEIAQICFRLLQQFDLDTLYAADADGMVSDLEECPDSAAVRPWRIFRNIQRVVKSPDVRIMVLFGSGHLGILSPQFQSSRQFELVRFSELEE